MAILKKATSRSKYTTQPGVTKKKRSDSDYYKTNQEVDKGYVKKIRQSTTKKAIRSAAEQTADRNAKAAGLKLSTAEKRKAVKAMEPRMAIDRGKTRARLERQKVLARRKELQKYV
jgi:hypothetical protein